MTRDMDLIRNILLKVEENTDGINYYSCNSCIPNISFNVMLYHLNLMEEAGLFYGKVAKDLCGGFSVRGLSNYGHDFLETIKNDNIWMQTKQEIEEKKLPKTIKFLAEVAGRFIGALLKAKND